jgi:peptide/nickel transport system substrate-binding protein
MNKKFFVLSLLVVFSLVLAACGSPAPAETKAPEAPAATDAPAAATEAPAAATEAPAAGPVVLKIAYSSTIDTWDPIASFSTEAAYLPNVYETLLKINKPGSAEQYTPVLAESWSVSDDKKSYTFKLRSGVKFHDGEPMNAAAVKASIDAVKDHGGAGFIWASLDNVEVVDDLTVKFNLKDPQPVDLIASSMYAAYIVSPKALEGFAADENFWADGKSYGTGPYMVESYTPDVEAVFTQNKEYWGAGKTVSTRRLSLLSCRKPPPASRCSRAAKLTSRNACRTKISTRLETIQNTLSSQNLPSSTILRTSTPCAPRWMM